MRMIVWPSEDDDRIVDRPVHDHVVGDENLRSAVEVGRQRCVHLETLR